MQGLANILEEGMITLVIQNLNESQINFIVRYKAMESFLLCGL